MIRQRVNLRTPGLAYVVRLLTAVFACALVWYGAMIVLLAVKVSPHTVNSISAYRSLYHDVAALQPSAFTTVVRLIAGFGGLLVFLVFVYLAFQELPRPYLTRAGIRLTTDPRGDTVAEPRAIERVAEIAAERNPDVKSASGRLGNDELNLDITSRRAALAAETLSDVQTRVRNDLERHELPSLPVNVTLAGYDRKTKRELL